MAESYDQAYLRMSLRARCRKASNLLSRYRRHLHIGILFLISFFFCPLGQMKARMTSSRHGLYKLGYTFATMKILNFERSVKCYEINVFSVRIAFCNLRCVKLELPVIANKPSCGEQVLKFCTNRPSRSGRRLALSAPKDSVWSAAD